MNDFEELYQQIIIEHSRSGKNVGNIPDATHFAEGINESCGDEIKVFLKIEDNIIREVKFSGEGCTISKASASIMCEKLVNLKVSDAKELSSFLQSVLHGKASENSEKMGDLIALSGVKNFPMRIKCATLPWHTFEKALEKI